MLPTLFDNTRDLSLCQSSSWVTVELWRIIIHMLNKSSKFKVQSSKKWRMNLALNEAKKCRPSEGNFLVGCVICSPEWDVLSTGYTWEVGPRDHAEQVAIQKAKDSWIDLNWAYLYCTLEPCWERKSFHTCCADLIIQAGISHVYYLEVEPSDFVDEPTGRINLKEAWVFVEKMNIN